MRRPIAYAISQDAQVNCVWDCAVYERTEPILLVWHIDSSLPCKELGQLSVQGNHCDRGRVVSCVLHHGARQGQSVSRGLGKRGDRGLKSADMQVHGSLAGRLL